MGIIGLLIDLDGTVYKGKRRIPGADEFVRRMKRERRAACLFVTNNSSRTPESVAEQLTRLGIEAESNDVYTSSQAACQYIVERNRGRKVYVVGETGLKQAILQSGLELDEDRPDYVVQGIDRDFTYAKLERATAYLRGGADYILTNPDLLLPWDDGFVPGAGAIAAAIRAAGRKEPVVIGKPSPIIMTYAMERIGLPPQNVWVIGDNLATDIAAGKAVGCKTALVLTGVATRDNVNGQIAETGVVPDLICGDLTELYDKLTD